MVKEKVSYDSIIRFLTKERDLAQKVKPSTIKEQVKIPAKDRELFMKKPHFDLEKYEETYVNHALEKPKFNNKPVLKFDQKKF
jgi:hypothetical protein